MLLLLPPSEGKQGPSGGRRRPLDLAALSWPELNGAREQVLDALAEVSARGDAHQVLGVGASLVTEVRRNTVLRTAATLPASRLYTGVLYDALGLEQLAGLARRRAAKQVVIVSALWGLLRPGDRVPAYRLAMDASLPPLKGTTLAAFWRPRLDPVLTAAAEAELVVDCRSTSYRAAWVPGAEVAARTVAVRVWREDAGRRTVVSHLAKATRGQVARHLLVRGGAPPRTPQGLARVVGEAFAVELQRPARPGATWSLDVVLEPST